MEFKQGLSQRIVIAFVLMTLLVGGVFGLGSSRPCTSWRSGCSPGCYVAIWIVCC